MAKPRITFLAFFLLWAKVQGWTVPALHVRICHWLENCTDPVRVLMVFRGAAKSTIYAVYKAWQLYCDNSWISLIWAADGPLATKLTRDTINVLRRHPLCGGMLPTKPGAQMFWVSGATDARNASMTAVGVNQNVTSARARDIDYDDVEVPKNIRTSEARENLRLKIQESTFILVPGGRETYIGTPHTHDSIYPELVSSGAALLKIPLFECAVRYEQTDKATRYAVPFSPGPDGLYVITGIHRFAKLLVEGTDYRFENGEVVFAKPPDTVIDIYAYCAWPERFTREDIIKRRKKTRTLNYWDSQYMLEAKPITETRLDPARIIPYDCEPVVRFANGEVGMWLGSTRIVGAVAYWDCSLGKIKSDASAFSLLLTDSRGQLYWHIAQGLTGELAEFDDKDRIIGGQVMQVRELVLKLQIPRVVVETNGPGGFVPNILRQALKGSGCGVGEEHSSVNKQKRILDAFEAPLSSRFLWAHVSVLEGPTWDQMTDFNPELTNQADDYLDSGAGAISQTPVRIGKIVGKPTATEREDWRPSAGVHEVELEY